ncbi:MAG: hypothetical protein ACT4O1_14755 [Gemmatimonadota bacterium]
MLITHRRVPIDRIEDYARFWHEVRRAASAAGARAWIFRADRPGDRFVEFVEWQADDAQSVIGRPDVADALAALSAAFPPQDSETWFEAKI